MCAVRRSLYRLECRFICSLTEGTLRSVVRASFLMYHGASAIIRSARFWTLLTFITFESEAMPHSWMHFCDENVLYDLLKKYFQNFSHSTRFIEICLISEVFVLNINHNSCTFPKAVEFKFLMWNCSCQFK